MKNIRNMQNMHKIKKVFLKCYNGKTYFYRSPTCLAPFYKNMHLHKLPQSSNEQ